MAQKDIKRVVLAYSGGLDTSIILKWLKDTYDCEDEQEDRDDDAVPAAHEPRQHRECARATGDVSGERAKQWRAVMVFKPEGSDEEPEDQRRGDRRDQDSR